MKRCNALTNRKAQGEYLRCQNGISSKGTVESGGKVYELCATHKKAFDRGNLVGFARSTGRPLAQPQLDLGPIAQAYVTREVAKTGLAGVETVRQKGLDEIRIMVTGHRLQSWSTEAERTAIKEGMRYVLNVVMAARPEASIKAVSGGADGVDAWWAIEAHKAGIQFILIEPHPSYHEHYHSGATWWRRLYDAAEDVQYSFSDTRPNGRPQPFHWSMNHKRNMDLIQAATNHMVVSNADLNQLLNARRGGTANCVKQMVEAGLDEVIHLIPETRKCRWSEPLAQ